MNDAELLDHVEAEAAAAVVTIEPAILARLLVLAGYDGMAAHHAMLADRRELVDVAGRDLLELVREARAKVGFGL